MGIAADVLSGMLAVVYFAAGMMKLTGAERAMTTADDFGIPRQRYRMIGFLDVAGAAGLVVGIWVAPIGTAAAAGLFLLMLGAIYFRLQAHQSKEAIGDAALLLAVAARLVLGLLAT